MAEERRRKGGRATEKPVGGKPAGGRSRWVKRLAAVATWLTGTAVVGGLLSIIGAGVAYRYYVVDHPGPEIDRDHVRAIISQESPVYYRDGTTRIGVFFEAEHRQYVPYADLPPAWVMGIVAAEDGGYWTHPGLNPKGILRAVRDNLLAGDLVAGGSTLTQQTAKNLYYRPDRSARAKLVELLYALRLEAHYDKEEILEFYANQFHVTGNGRGLGIAARHFFDRDVTDLGVLECAFLAGLVKGPANYDPFLGDEARRDKAVGRATDRTRYVLGRLLDEPLEHLAGPPSDGTPAGDRAHSERLATAQGVRAEARRLLDEGFELPFRHGNFRYESSAVLDEVARRLAEPPFDTILGDGGIDDVRNAGLVVVTTLDPAAQREATWSLWHHLTEVGTWMEALTAPDFVLEGHRGPRFDPDDVPKRHEYRVARVVERPGEPGKRTIMLDLGGHRCQVDRDGVVRVAVATERGQRKDSSAKAPSAVVDAWVDALPDQAVVLASVREVPAVGDALCDLEVRPELQGAVTVVQDGEVRAMVGGNDNRNFNRATALRQFGSTWKPLVYHAALSLGWSPDDPLDNTRNVFPFSTTFYYPSPDHHNAPTVSMAWAGVNSENVASIWLLYHLTDPLDGEQVRELATQLDLAQRPGEDPKAYRARIQKLGVLPTRDRVDEGLFLQARQEVLAGLASSAHPEDDLALRSLLYGWGFASERVRAGREGPSTRAWKSRALSNDWQSLNERLSGCGFAYEALADALHDGRLPDPEVTKDLSAAVDGEVIHVGCGEPPEGYAALDEAFLASVRPAATPTQVELDPAPAPRPRFRLFGGSRDLTTPEPEPAGPRLAPLEDLLLDDRLHVSTVQAVADAVRRRELALETAEAPPDLYSPEILYWHQDFRVLLAMRYITSLAEDYGVATEIREVLAMPLGASEITLEEAVSMYGGLTTGQAWEFPGRARGRAVDAIATSTLLIAEIRDVDGNVLYRADPRSLRVTDAAVGSMTNDILRNVVLHGTGRRAASAVKLGGKLVPVGGKTGTTNDFRNAAFVGSAPRAATDGFHVEGGYTVGAYVGYDDNRSMEVGRIRLQGASGALPAWIGTVDGLARAGLLGAPPVVEVSDVWPLIEPRGTARVTVDPEVGLSATGEGAATVLVREAWDAGLPDLVVPRIERPARVAPGTESAPTEASDASPRAGME